MSPLRGQHKAAGMFRRRPAHRQSALVLVLILVILVLVVVLVLIIVVLILVVVLVLIVVLIAHNFISILRTQAENTGF